MKKILSAFFGLLMVFGASDARTLVTYYSGDGDTAAVAQQLNKMVPSDIFEIKSSGAGPDLDGYNWVFVATPMVDAGMAAPVRKFVESAPLDGLVVIPLVVYSGGDVNAAARVGRDIVKATPDSYHMTSAEIPSSDAKNSARALDTWLTELGFVHNPE